MPAVPDLTANVPGALCSPSAQHAVRQAKRLADNIARRSCAAARCKQYRHKHVGSVASLGLHKGVAQVYGIKVRGLPAWFMHRTYHLSRIPSLNRKIRVDRRLDAGPVPQARGGRRWASCTRPASRSPT